MNSKAIAGREAAQLVQNGMQVGLGTGSTAYYMLLTLGERVQEGLRFVGVPTSERTAQMARELEIPLKAPHEVSYLDLTIDGADEFDPAFNLIKGGGGALYREKLVASLSRRLVIVADARKQVAQLGAFPLPIEVVPFGWEITARRVEGLGAVVARRETAGHPYQTDNGNYILDCRFGEISDPPGLHARLKALLGVVETGLFCGMATEVYLGQADGSVQVLHPQRHG